MKTKKKLILFFGILLFFGKYLLAADKDVGGNTGVTGTFGDQVVEYFTPAVKALLASTPKRILDIYEIPRCCWNKDYVGAKKKAGEYFDEALGVSCGFIVDNLSRSIFEKGIPEKNRFSRLFILSVLPAFCGGFIEKEHVVPTAVLGAIIIATLTWLTFNKSKELTDLGDKEKARLDNIMSEGDFRNRRICRNLATYLAAFWSTYLINNNETLKKIVGKINPFVGKVPKSS